MIERVEARECRKRQGEKSTPKDRQRSAQQVAIAAIHKRAAFGDQPPGAILEESGCCIPVLANAVLSENSYRDLPIGCASKAAIEGKQGLPEPLVSGWRERGDGDGSGRIRESLERLQAVNACGQVVEAIDLEG